MFIVLLPYLITLLGNFSYTTLPNMNYSTTEYILSSISRAYELYKQLNISIQNIPNIQMIQKYSVNNYAIYDSISLISKHERSEQQWQHLFHDLSENIYTKHIPTCVH